MTALLREVLETCAPLLPTPAPLPPPPLSNCFLLPYHLILLPYLLHLLLPYCLHLLLPCHLHLLLPYRVHLLLPYHLHLLLTIPPPSPATIPSPSPATIPPPAMNTPTAATVESSALQDVSSRSNVVGTDTQGGYVVPPDVVSSVIFRCKSRRNKAARLAGKLFNVHKSCRSNCRGVLGKMALDVHRVKAIFSTCMQHFPLQRLETQVLADKEMRTAIDKLCPETKTSHAVDRENYYSYGGGSLV